MDYAQITSSYKEAQKLKISAQNEMNNERISDFNVANIQDQDLQQSISKLKQFIQDCQLALDHKKIIEGPSISQFVEKEKKQLKKLEKQLQDLEKQYTLWWEKLKLSVRKVFHDLSEYLVVYSTSLQNCAKKILNFCKSTLGIGQLDYIVKYQVQDNLDLLSRNQTLMNKERKKQQLKQKIRFVKEQIEEVLDLNKRFSKNTQKRITRFIKQQLPKIEKKLNTIIRKQSK